MEIEKIEITEQVVGVRTHIVEGWIRREPEGFNITGVLLPDGTEGVIPVNNIIEQYEGQEVRIVVVSLEDAQRLVNMAEEMANEQTTEENPPGG